MTAAAPTPTTERRPLPPLRRDLQVELLPVRGGGFPAVIVTDPVRGSYFRLAWPESGILLLWQEADSAEDLCRKLLETYGVPATVDTIHAVAKFAFTNQLTETDQTGTWANYAALQSAGRHGWFITLIHGYLFFRVPIVRPEPLLHHLLPHLALVYKRSFWMALASLAIFGTYLATRQWTAIVAEFQSALRLDGLHIYAAVVLCLKAIHELGHGLTTARMGCRVPTMGVAVMLGVPVFYSDTSDSWRLSKRTERLAIIFSGVAAEMIVASVAILVWSFLDDGPLRTICFALATTSIILSLTINLNPFMRFDGYFALSDYLGIPNLQSRAFALATWRLRQSLFDLGHPPPEVLPRRMVRILTTYAVLTAIYRLFLFLGIAAAVYIMFGKAIGIILGLFEIVVFIALPIARELSVWWKLRREIIARRRSRWLAGVVTVLAALFFTPWLSTVEVPAVLTTAKEEAIYLPFPAKLIRIDVVDGQLVEPGETLFRADTADLEQQRKKAILEQRALEFQANRLHASEKEREGRVIMESRLARAREKAEALERQIEQLVIRAPFAGKIVDLDPQISVGLWLNPKHSLARLVSTRGARVKGLLSDSELPRIAIGASAVFIADDAAVPRRSLSVTFIAPAADGRLAETVLADRHGGSVPSGDENGVLRARHGWFELTFDSPLFEPEQIMRGVARVDAARTSPAALAFRHFARVLVRERGF
jgi:putative peptide zinc metalloprotease protein